MPLIRMKTHRVKRGMIIKSDVFNRSGVILVPKDTVVTNDVLTILSRHFIEDVVVEYGLESKPALNHSPEKPPLSKTEQKEIKLKEATHIYKVAEDTLSQNLKEIVQKDKEVDIPSLLGLLQNVIDKTDEQLSIFDLLHHMQQDSDTLYSHSINVSLYAQLLARWAGLEKDEIELVSLAGLLHDIGHLRYADSDTEPFTLYDAMKKNCHEQHPTFSYRILQNKDIDHRIKQAVLTHHERFDQSGFPLGVSYVNINKITRVLSIADSYVTLITEEFTYPGMVPFEALKYLQEVEHNKYDYSLLSVFVEHIALNYVQHDVVLSDGRIGTILMINKNDIARPLVQIGNFFVDLSTQTRLSIKKIL